MHNNNATPSFETESEFDLEITFSGCANPGDVDVVYIDLTDLGDSNPVIEDGTMDFSEFFAE